MKIRDMRKALDSKEISAKELAQTYFVETGRVVMEGTGAELLTNERVRSAYLGG